MIMFIIQKNEASNKTIRMSNTLIEQLEEIAANEDISFNQLVVQCCEYALANLPKNDGKIACTEQFISQKRQIKKAFLDYMAGQSDVSKSTATTIFSDAIFASQPNNAALGVDLYDLFSGELSIDEYQKQLERFLRTTGRREPEAKARGYAKSAKILKEFMEQANLI